MPLVPLVPPTEDVEIEGDIYTIKTMLTSYERDQTDAMQAWKIQMPFGKVEKNIRPEEMVDIVMDKAVANLRALRIWLVRWSHPEPLIAENIRRIPPSHQQAILERVEELGKAQDLSADSPLLVYSNGSYETNLSMESET